MRGSCAGMIIMEELESISTWPLRDSPKNWLPHTLDLLSEPGVSQVFIDPNRNRGGKLSFRCDGAILSGPQFSVEQYSVFVETILAHLVLGSAGDTEGVFWHEGKEYVCGILSTHRGISLTLRSKAAWHVAQPFKGWPSHAVDVIEKMRRHPNGLMVFCHRPFSTMTDSMFHLFRVMQQEHADGRFGCVTESFANLLLQDDCLSIRVTTERASWERALSSLMAQDVDVCAMAGRDDAEATAQAALFALEDRGALVNVSLHTVTDTLLWLTSELRIEPMHITEVLLGVVGTYKMFKRVCSHCCEPYQPDESSLAVLKVQNIQASPEDVWMRGRGCENCNQTGYTPTGGMIAEAVYVDRELAHLLASRPTREQLNSFLAECGFRTYFEQMLEYARNGEAALEEAIRVGLARRADL